MNIDARREKQKPISVNAVGKAFGRCRPSLSISASESVPGGKPISVSLVCWSLDSCFMINWYDT